LQSGGAHAPKDRFAAFLTQPIQRATLEPQVQIEETKVAEVKKGPEPEEEKTEYEYDDEEYDEEQEPQNIMELNSKTKS